MAARRPYGARRKPQAPSKVGAHRRKDMVTLIGVWLVGFMLVWAVVAVNGGEGDA